MSEKLGKLTRRDALKLMGSGFGLLGLAIVTKHLFPETPESFVETVTPPAKKNPTKISPSPFPSPPPSATMETIYLSQNTSTPPSPPPPEAAPALGPEYQYVSELPPIEFQRNSIGPISLEQPFGFFVPAETRSAAGSESVVDEVRTVTPMVVNHDKQFPKDTVDAFNDYNNHPNDVIALWTEVEFHTLLYGHSYTDDHGYELLFDFLRKANKNPSNPLVGKNIYLTQQHPDGQTWEVGLKCVHQTKITAAEFFGRLFRAYPPPKPGEQITSPLQEGPIFAALDVFQRRTENGEAESIFPESARQPHQITLATCAGGEDEKGEFNSYANRAIATFELVKVRQITT